MRAVDIIMKKRGNPDKPTGSQLSRAELEFLVGGYVRAEIPDYQISSWLMSVYFNGMTFAETGDLTEVMLRSGSVMDLSGIPGPFVDKHSTGGVGDKISLPLAPIAAACVLRIPMMSGRALGHTGGTLDKLDSITGYRTTPSPEDFRRILTECGFAMTGQTPEIVPADRLLYALRDVTGTVESVPLITASILSKKVAEGSDALLFDVKCGTGAFMKNLEDATRLAESLTGTARAMGKKAVALITRMDRPLGRTVGNFLEIEETMDILDGKGPHDTTELTELCAAWMILLSGTETKIELARKRCQDVIATGKAMEFFLRNVELQGGDVNKLLSDRGKRRSVHQAELRASRTGWITGIEAYKTGLAGVHLGVGRNRTDEAVSAEAGIIFHKTVGEYVVAGDLVAEVFGRDRASIEPALPLLTDAVAYGDTAPPDEPLIYREISAV